MADAFLEKPVDGRTYEVHHKDGNPANNAANNLQWVKRSENVRFRPICTFFRKPVTQMTLEGKPLRKFASGVEASKETGVNGGLISLCCNGHRVSAGGFVWTSV